MGLSPLVENKEVRQRPDEGFRRWFVNRHYDIIFWYDREGGSLIGFQFCYGKPYHEKAYTCGETFSSHRYVSSYLSDSGAGVLETAILKGTAGLIPDEEIERFREEQGDLDPDLAEIIIEKMEDFNRRYGD